MRQNHLNASDYSAYPQGRGAWGVIGENGVVASDFTSEREAEDHIIIHIRGVFDDL